MPIAWREPIYLSPYRLPAVDIKQPVIRGSTCEAPDGVALSYAGDDRDAADGLAHTRLHVNRTWADVRDAFRNDLRQGDRDRVWLLRNTLKDLPDRARTV